MKFKAFALLTVLALAVALLGAASPVSAAAFGTSFVTSITYMNVGTGPATITLTFYDENSATPILIPLPDLAVNAGASINVGGVTSVAAGFKGSAVMSSDQPLAATMVQLPPVGSAVKNRPLSNGFSGGASYVLIATALKNTFATNSIISVQNVDTVGADVTVNFVPVGGTAVPITVTNLPSGAAKYFDLNTIGSLGGSFNGSVQITSVKTGTTTPGSVVATSLEASTANNNVYAFEGIATTSDTIYMPSAFCNYGGAISSAYAIQNTSTTASVDIKVTYSNGNNETKTAVGPGAKVSLSGCSAGNPNGFIGSAVVTTVPAGGAIVGIAKITGNGLSTAFVGVGDGAAKLYAPYVRYTEAHWLDGTKQRTFIAIQNVGGADLAAGAVTIKYYDKDGNLVGTDTNAAALVVGGKFSSAARNVGPVAAEFGYIGTTFGGSAVIEGPVGSKLAVVARVQTSTGGTSTVGEDYNGIP
jgi:hypothetical protein